MNKALAIAILSGAASVLSGSGRAEPSLAPGRTFENAVLIGWDGADRRAVQEMLAGGSLPNLAKLIAEGGFVATQVTTGATETKPGWAEILTGRSADVMGIESNVVYKPIPAGFTVFEALKKRVKGMAAIFIAAKTNNLSDRGPHEICINCITRMPPDFEKTQWWDKEKILPKTRTYGGLPRRWVAREGEPYYLTAKALDEYLSNLGPADHVGKEALSALDRYHGSRFIAFFHFEDPDELGHRFGEGTKEYADGLRAADKWLGIILEKLRSLGVYDRTAVFVTADHGFDKGKRSHQFAPDTFLATNLKRPMRAGDRKDVSPTILDALGVDPASVDPRMAGRSLFVLATAGSVAPSRP